MKTTEGNFYKTRRKSQFVFAMARRPLALTKWKTSEAKFLCKTSTTSFCKTFAKLSLVLLSSLSLQAAVPDYQAQLKGAYVPANVEDVAKVPFHYRQDQLVEQLNNYGFSNSLYYSTIDPNLRLVLKHMTALIRDTGVMEGKHMVVSVNADVAPMDGATLFATPSYVVLDIQKSRPVSIEGLSRNLKQKFGFDYLVKDRFYTLQNFLYKAQNDFFEKLEKKEKTWLPTMTFVELGAKPEKASASYIVVIDPYCPHCQNLIKEFKKRFDLSKDNVKIVMWPILGERSISNTIAFTKELYSSNDLDDFYKLSLIEEYVLRPDQHKIMKTVSEHEVDTYSRFQSSMQVFEMNYILKEQGTPAIFSLNPDDYAKDK